jgi:DNA-directed RNA polymerase specialized sigma24 family protein
MTLSQDIAPHLPFLRRYARALTGSQKSGDAYVMETLEAIIEDPDSFPRADGPRVGLYRVFTALWSAVPDNASPDAAYVTDAASPALSNLARLTPHSRQAFLLKTVEGFAASDVAAILHVDIDTVARFISRAGREIAECVATDVLIIEDEAVIAAELSLISRELGHSIVGIARTRDEAKQLAAERTPRLVLVDIHLADGSSGIDAVNDLLEVADTPVIFITAYPERLLTGQRPEPAFLISKPYNVDAVKATICQSLFFDQKASRPSN